MKALQESKLKLVFKLHHFRDHIHKRATLHKTTMKETPFKHKPWCIPQFGYFGKRGGLGDLCARHFPHGGCTAENNNKLESKDATEG